MMTCNALILAGGRVDELGVLTLQRPKSAVPFGGLYRIIDFPLSNLMHSDIERVGILSQYRSDSLIHHISSGASWDMYGSQRGITFLPPMKGTKSSDWYKGTADAVYQNLEYLYQNRADHVLILSGDHVYKMDYQQLIGFHQRMSADLTISFVQSSNRGISRFGQGVIADDDEEGGRLTQYAEKPSAPISDWVSMTAYLFSYDVLIELLHNLNSFPAHEHFGRDIFPSLLQQIRVCGYKFKGYWAYTRTIGEYWRANMQLLEDSSAIDPGKWQVRTNWMNQSIHDLAPTRIGNSAEVSASMVHNGCVIEGVVENSVIFPGVQVHKNAVVRNSILMFNTIVGGGARLDKTITDINVQVGNNVCIGDKDMDLQSEQGIGVVARETKIPAGTRIEPGYMIYPDLKGEKIVEKF
ncbi:glucose-1-phosphate adenylyltransferase [candidate division KSB1 bacterium]|nr:glucose-1-phosphate adenylyltransferase [candidate division KSB1 bacterium]